MSNRLKLYLSLLSVTVLLILIAGVYAFVTRPKVAYVRSLEIIYEYNGMKDARNKFNAQNDEWKANVDTLKTRYERALAEYQAKFPAYSKQERASEQAILAQMEEDMNKYVRAISDEAKDRENKVTEAVLSQINSFIQEYAKKKGYDIVLGADGSGAVLYGSHAMDITNEVLVELNSNYRMLPDGSSEAGKSENHVGSSK